MTTDTVDRDKILLEVKDLKKYFPVKKGFLQRTVGQVKAVDGVSFSIREGEIFGLVGESGCGKSTTGRTILNLIEPTNGTIIFNGRDITHLSAQELQNLRKDMQIIFQDPFASLDPRMKIRDIIAEPMITHRLFTSREELMKEVERLIEVVGLNRSHLNRYPHEFSGGQRQRISIARTLSLNPKLVIADESVSALDVSIQSQILNLLKELQKQFHLTMIFISHDLSVVKHISDRVGVMYLGQLVEIADKKDIYYEPLHPYSQALISSMPIADPKLKREAIILQGELPNPSNPPSGCPFHPRCPQRMDVCETMKPQLIRIKGNHQVACHLYEEAD